MPKRSSTANTRDVNEAALDAVGQIVKLTEASEQRSEKNPAAVALGRRGGLKGGPARAEALSPTRRRQIALRAAQARWKAKEQG